MGVGVLGGMTAIVSNTITESKRNGIFKVRRERDRDKGMEINRCIKGTLLGLTTGALDTITKPVQGVFDFVEGTASAIKHVSEWGEGREGESLFRHHLHHLVVSKERDFVLLV